MFSFYVSTFIQNHLYIQYIDWKHKGNEIRSVVIKSSFGIHQTKVNFLLLNVLNEIIKTFNSLLYWDYFQLKYVALLSTIAHRKGKITLNHLRIRNGEILALFCSKD